jgi:RNA polymerase sigma-70 factor, ECF subfamily
MLSTPVSLLERIRQSADDSAWGKFVDMYTPLLLKWSKRVGLRDTEISDLVQDIFAILVVKLPDFEYDPQRSFRAWLKTVLLNCWRKRQRKRQPEVRQPRGAPGEAERDDLAEAAVADPVAEFEEEEYRRYLVQRALSLMQVEFAPATWRACWEFVVHDRPAAEVAAELGISVNAVYLAKSRVLRRLRAELKGLLD